jgi:hypothetical protein
MGAIRIQPVSRPAKTEVATKDITNLSKALALRHHGKSFREIAMELGIGKDTV